MPTACHAPETGPSWHQSCAGHRRCCNYRGERRGGCKEARRIPGGGEEDDKARRYKTGWMRLGVGRRKRRVATLAARTRTGSWGREEELRRSGQWQRGTRQTRGGCPSLRFGGGALLPTPVDCHRPFDGDGLDGGDKWQSNRSY